MAQIDISDLFNPTTGENWLYKEYKKQIIMAQQTAMQIMYDELMAHEYTIPLSLIVKCKELIEMEKEQIINAFLNSDNSDCTSEQNTKEFAEQYYNETYNK